MSHKKKQQFIIKGTEEANNIKEDEIDDQEVTKRLENEICHGYGTPNDEEPDHEEYHLAYLGKLHDSLQSPELPLIVVKCALTQQKPEDDWRWTNIFSIYAKCSEKNCKVMVDSGSCTNVVSTNTVKRLGLSLIPHPWPYLVMWVDASSIPVSHRCQVPIKLSSYKDTLWCDVVPMDVGHIILGQPWLYNRDVTMYGWFNTCTFDFKGKRIKLVPRPPKVESKVKSKMEKGKSVKKDKSKALHIISSKEFK